MLKKNERRLTQKLAKQSSSSFHWFWADSPHLHSDEIPECSLSADSCPPYSHAHFLVLADFFPPWATLMLTCWS